MMICPIARFAEISPERPAILTSEGAISYLQLDRRIRSAQAWLSTQGFERGARIAVCAPCSPELVSVLFACFRMGAIVGVLNHRLPEAALEDQVRELGARRIELTVPASSRETGAGAAWSLHLPATAIFTSGSTGKPKIAVHSLANHLRSAQGSAENIPIASGDRWLLNLPLFHVGGLAILFRSFLAGAAIAIPTHGEELEESLRWSKPTHLSLVSTQLYRLLRSGSSLASAKAILLGGSAIPEDLIEELGTHGLPFHLSYGLTEMSSQVTTTRAGETGHSGHPLSGRELRIRDSEILVRGETLFLGYLKGREIHSPVDDEGWFHTGDLGALTSEGNLAVSGRKDNLFISGGENIQPEEIEAAILRLSCVQAEQVIVVPREDREFGFRPVAFLNTRAESLDPAAISRELGTILPRFKIPVAILPWPVDSAPSGLKPSRAEFRARVERLAPTPI